MKEWVSVPCVYCNSTIPFIKLADVMKVKCRKCSRLQTVSIPSLIVIEEPEEEDQTAYEVKVEPKIFDKPKKKKKEDVFDVTDTTKNIDYKIGE